MPNSYGEALIEAVRTGLKYHVDGSTGDTFKAHRALDDLWKFMGALEREVHDQQKDIDALIERAVKAETGVRELTENIRAYSEVADMQCRRAEEAERDAKEKQKDVDALLQAMQHIVDALRGRRV